MTGISATQNLQAYIKLTIMSLFFGGTFIAGRLIANEIPAAPAAFLRFTIAAVCLLGLLYWQERHFPIPSFTECLGLACLGFTGILGYNFFFFLALQTVEAAHTAALISCNPVLIAILSALFLGERISKLKAVGISLSVSGALMVAAKGNWQTLVHFSAGDKAVVGAISCWALYSVIGKQVLKTLSPLVSVAYATLFGALVLAAITVHGYEAYSISALSSQTWLGILYLALPGTVIAFLFYYQGIESLGVTKAGIFINLIPVSTLILSVPILGEIPDLNVLAGILMVICGVLLVNRS